MEICGMSFDEGAARKLPPPRLGTDDIGCLREFRGVPGLVAALPLGVQISAWCRQWTCV